MPKALVRFLHQLASRSGAIEACSVLAIHGLDPLPTVALACPVRLPASRVILGSLLPPWSMRDIHAFPLHEVLEFLRFEKLRVRSREALPAFVTGTMSAMVGAYDSNMVCTGDLLIVSGHSHHRQAHTDQ